jgi:Spy/CpxP family protein refolding chaperone
MRALLLLAALLLAGCATHAPPPAVAPHAHTDGMTHDANMTHNGTSPYVALLDTALGDVTPEEQAILQDGDGGGLALPAELHDYPGPKHVLALADELGLNASQRAATHALFDATNAEARRLGADILQLHRELDSGFANHTIDDATLRVLTRALSQAYGELRSTHLSAHLRMAALLTPHQVALYHELRGYGPADHAKHSHAG